MVEEESISARRSAIESALRSHEDGASLELAALRRLEDEVPDATFGGGRWLSRSAARMNDAELEEVRAGCEPRHDDPVAIYARAFFASLGTAVSFPRDYLVAIRVPGRLEEVAGWKVDMLADGLPQCVVEACCRRLHRMAPARA